MRTHKIIFTCNSIGCAKVYEQDILHTYFCDFTHWYCGLDNSGDDTPECCIIYRGMIHPEIITVEIDAKSLFDNSAEDNINILKKCQTFKPHKLNIGNFEILDVKFEELESYIKLKTLSAELLQIKSNLSSLFDS